MSKENRPATRKQKILITLIVITVILLIGSFGSDDGRNAVREDVDKSTCLQQGGVWSNADEVCYTNSAQRFPRSYVGICSGEGVSFDVVLLDKGQMQVILSESSPPIHQLQRSGEDDGVVTYAGSDNSATAKKTDRKISVQLGDETTYTNCKLTQKNPDAPDNTDSANLSVRETSRAGGIDITLQGVQDNRCPVDATCVDDGRFTADVSLRNGEDNTQVKLANNGIAYDFSGQKITVPYVQPPKVADKDISNKRYRVTFWVTPTGQ